jgi:predicted DNA-binding transcriptional regulator YafY
VQDVIIKCEPHEYNYISTRPIHPTQRPIKDKPNHIKIKVQENYELYQWLLFYGDRIEIVSPESIRQEFQNILARMMRRYKKL